MCKEKPKDNVVNLAQYRKAKEDKEAEEEIHYLRSLLDEIVGTMEYIGEPFPSRSPEVPPDWSQWYSTHFDGDGYTYYDDEGE